jgi:hypothetical protein
MEPEPNPSKTHYADLGMQVVLDLVTEEGSERLELEIVPDDFADFTRGYLGISTLLARTIVGKKAGEVIPYPVEGGREVQLIQVVPSHKAPPQEIADRRQEILRKALDQSDQTNAVIFASSFSGKWGDYDPTGFTDDPEKKET